MRYFCGPYRGFQIHITDNQNKEVLTLERPFECCAGCCWCANSDPCAMKLFVRDSQGTILGTVKQRCMAKIVQHYRSRKF